jgi:ketosteroid isomerase-like protein
LKPTPQKATVSKAGDIGYIVGTYEISMTGPDGAPRSSQGRYLTAWRKNEAGNWKCTLEIHSPLNRSSPPELQMALPKAEPEVR